MTTDFSTYRTGSGTREWSEHSVNIGQGCSHGCLYCYARYNAVARFKTVPADQWRSERLVRQVDEDYPLRDGVIMFPTTHDITPFYLADAASAILRMVRAGNRVLIVTKPHRDCVRVLLDALEGHRSQVLFRFTITTLNPATSAYWEPGAPLPEERLECLIMAHSRGFQTSVSAEPLLGGSATGIELFRAVSPYVTDRVWFGKMNDPWRRILELDVLHDCRRRAGAIEKAQRDFNIIDLYNAVKDDPRAAWKESMQKVIDRHVKTGRG